MQWHRDMTLCLTQFALSYPNTTQSSTRATTSRRYLVLAITCCIPTKAFNTVNRLDGCSFVYLPWSWKKVWCQSWISYTWMTVRSAASWMIFNSILIQVDELVQRSACCSMRTNAKLKPTITTLFKPSCPILCTFRAMRQFFLAPIGDETT